MAQPPAAPRRPEILAPAGDRNCLPAAVSGGADAVYLGLRHFNARGRAENFRKADLPADVAYLHQHGLRCYVVLNTLLHDDEHPKALDLARAAAEAGVDAFIVQDLGLWRSLSHHLPAMELHASTQMTVHHPSQVEVLAGLGARRVILARELALDEVAACTDAAASLGIETEHFVHGALCYAFSGACLISNFAGCRSANRGTCAQNCRFDYRLSAASGSGPTTAPGPLTAEDAAPPDTVLSMKDLSLIDRIGPLSDLGVACFKIEGRLKGPDYVYTTSRSYRQAVDAWAARTTLAPEASSRLRDVFQRGLTNAPLVGEYGPQSRLHRYRPDLDGACDAILIRLDRRAGRAELTAEAAPKPGQGFRYAHGMFTGGFLVTAVDPLPEGHWRCRVRVDRQGPSLPEGLPLYRNSDHERRREATQAMAAIGRPGPAAATPRLDLMVQGREAEPLQAEAMCADGRRARTTSTGVLGRAATSPVDLPLLERTLGALGTSGLRLGAIDNRCPPGLFLPAAELKAMRRRLVDEIHAQTPMPPEAGTADLTNGGLTDGEDDASEATEALPAPETHYRRRSTRIWVAVGTMALARVALEAGADLVWLDDPGLDLWGTRPPIIDRTGIPEGRLYLRHGAVTRPSPHLGRLALPVVAGHLGILAQARELGLAAIADQSLNCVSAATAAVLGDLGARAVVVSLECSAGEIARLASGLADPVPLVAAVVHGRLPAMLSRQDHGLRVGETRAMVATRRDGGLPYALERRSGGVTVVWEARRLCCPAPVQGLAGLVDAWVLELAGDEEPAVRALTRAYVGLRDGSMEPGAVEAVAAAHGPMGCFPGHLHRGSRALDRVREETLGVAAEPGEP